MGRLPRRLGCATEGHHRPARTGVGRLLLQHHGERRLPDGRSTARGDRHPREVQPAHHRRHRQTIGLGPGGRIHGALGPHGSRQCRLSDARRRQPGGLTRPRDLDAQPDWHGARHRQARAGVGHRPAAHRDRAIGHRTSGAAPEYRSRGARVSGSRGAARRHENRCARSRCRRVGSRGRAVHTRAHRGVRRCAGGRAGPALCGRARSRVRRDRDRGRRHDDRRARQRHPVARMGADGSHRRDEPTRRDVVSSRIRLSARDFRRVSSGDANRGVVWSRPTQPSRGAGVHQRMAVCRVARRDRGRPHPRSDQRRRKPGHQLPRDGQVDPGPTATRSVRHHRDHQQRDHGIGHPCAADQGSAGTARHHHPRHPELTRVRPAHRCRGGSRRRAAIDVVGVRRTSADGSATTSARWEIRTAAPTTTYSPFYSRAREPNTTRWRPRGGPRPFASYPPHGSTTTSPVWAVGAWRRRFWSISWQRWSRRRRW